MATLFTLTFGMILGKRRAYWFTIAGITLYLLLVDADVAVVRADLMDGLLTNQVLILTLAAQVLTIPLVVYHLGRLSLVAPLANLLILMAQAPIMSLGRAAAILDACRSWSRWPGWLTWSSSAPTSRGHSGS